jgi:hypothetical protein
VDSKNLENGAADITLKQNVQPAKPTPRPTKITAKNTTQPSELDLTRIEQQLDQILVRLKHVDRRDRIRMWTGFVKILIPLIGLFMVYYMSDSIITSITERFGTIFQFAIPGADGLEYNIELPEGIALPDGLDASALPEYLKSLLQ